MASSVNVRQALVKDGVAVLKFLALFALAVSAALSSAQSAQEASGRRGHPEGWVKYVNGAHRYELWHPPDWAPNDTTDRSLKAFRVQRDQRPRDFWVMHTPADENLSLEQVLASWKPDLARAEGARYLLRFVRERRLGPNRALEIPMAGTREYQAALWLLDVGGQKYRILAEIKPAEPTVRRILATMRRQPRVALPSQPQWFQILKDLCLAILARVRDTFEIARRGSR